MQTNPSSRPHGRPRSPPIQFYSIELTPLADGRVSVGVGATMCQPVDECDFEFVSIELASARAESIDQALGVIREVLVTTMLH